MNIHSQDQFDRIVTARLTAPDFAKPKLFTFTGIFMLVFLVLALLMVALLSKCSPDLNQNAHALAYKAQFQNANEHAVFVRKLGAE